MRKRFMDKGAEMGLWNAEDFQSETASGEEVSVPKREMSFPLLTSLRDDNLTLGSLCLGATAEQQEFSLKNPCLTIVLKPF